MLYIFQFNLFYIKKILILSINLFMLQQKQQNRFGVILFNNKVDADLGRLRMKLLRSNFF